LGLPDSLHTRASDEKEGTNPLNGEAPKAKSYRPDSKRTTSTPPEALLLSVLDSLALPPEVIETEISGLKFNPGIDDGFVYGFAVGAYVWPGLILH
jgi:hypothetical protein